MGRIKRILTISIIIIFIFTRIPVFGDTNDGQIPPQDIEGERALMEEKSNEIIVKFRKDTGKSKSNRILKNYSLAGDAGDKLGDNSRLISSGGQDIDELIREIEKDPAVEYVEKNYIYGEFSSPNDSYYKYQWYLENIGAERAWEKPRSNREVIVAVIDSGIDQKHRDLANRIEEGGYNFLNNNSFIHDYNGHGSLVSGIIAAEVNNNFGIAGVAGDYNVKILALKVSNSEGHASVGDIARAIDYSIDKNVDIINISLGGHEYSNYLYEAVQRAIDANILVVAAAGNDALKGNPINYPAAYDNVLSVGATDKNNRLAAFSSYNEFVDLVAPGEGVLSTNTYDRFSYGDGTSFSAPMVAAGAALLRSMDSKISVGQMKEILTETAVDLGPRGRDIYYGHGLLDIDGALGRLYLSNLTRGYSDFILDGVEEDKILRVEFNLPISLDKLNNSIYASLDQGGQGQGLGIGFEIDREREDVLYIRPLYKWVRGYNYIFIDDKLEGKNSRKHNNKVRIIINVR